MGLKATRHRAEATRDSSDAQVSRARIHEKHQKKRRKERSQRGAKIPDEDGGADSEFHVENPRPWATWAMGEDESNDWVQETDW